MSKEGNVISLNRSHRLHIRWTLVELSYIVGAILGVAYIGWELNTAFVMWQNGAEGWLWQLVTVLLTIAFTFLYARENLYAIAFVHRGFAHMAFEMGPVIQIVKAALFYAAVEGWVKIWCGWHRQHHENEDTEFDVHSPKKWGFLHAQMLWHWKVAFIKPAPGRYTKHLSDKAYAPLQWMEERYIWIAPVMAFLVPVLICGLWGDWLGGLLFAGFFRIFLVQQLTSMVNSVAHTWGESVDGSKSSSRNSRSRFLLWLIVGELNHANHHRWSQRYRLGSCDPAASRIEFYARMGAISNLRGEKGAIFYPKAA